MAVPALYSLRSCFCLLLYFILSSLDCLHIPSIANVLLSLYSWIGFLIAFFCFLLFILNYPTSIIPSLSHASHGPPVHPLAFTLYPSVQPSSPKHLPELRQACRAAALPGSHPRPIVRHIIGLSGLITHHLPTDYYAYCLPTVRFLVRRVSFLSVVGTVRRMCTQVTYIVTC